MAKKKRKKRRPDRRPSPAAPPQEPRAEAAERPVSARAERKEQARRERERRIKQARRRQRMRRATRWGAVLGVTGAVVAVIVYNNVQSGQEQQRAEAAAERINCDPIETQPDAVAGLSQQQIHSPPFAQGTGGQPATAGRHSNTLPAPPFVYDQPIPEANVVHNLEHGYVVIYYAAEGANAVADDIRSALENLVQEESSKVLLAPYPDLAHSFDLVAWRKLQTCDPPADADPDDAVLVARSFIDQFRGGGLAPEPAGA